jgi:solute carrier family 35 protein E3
MPSNDLLAQTALAQGSTLMIFGPVMDFLFSQRWVSTYEFSDIRAFHFLLLSCVLAMGVNFSQFLVLGKFSAVTFQLMGHLKTMLVLILGWYFFGGIVTVTQTTGMCLAIGGMVGYGYTTAPTKKVESADANDDNDEEAQHPKTPTGGLDRVNVK